MRNRYLEKYDNIVKVKVEGKNIYHYVFRIYKKKIQIIKLIPISYRQVHLIMKYSEYQKLEDIKSVLYQVTILNYLGKLKIKKMIKKNFILLLFLAFGIFSLFVLSRFIFSIDVIHQDREIRNLVFSELNKYHIRKYRFKKSYEKLEEIEDRILESNKDRLEWIEIIARGTKYIVRVEERKINEENVDKVYQNIVSKKDAVLVNVRAISGEKLKTVNDYVKKGDIIIAGYITLPDNSKVPTIAEGEVLGEVWYTVKIDYPFVYQESNLTGHSKTVFAFHVFNKRFGLFDFKKYKTFTSKNQILLSSLLLNISFVKEKHYEMIIRDEVYTEDIAKNKGIDYIKQKLMNNNKNIKEIKEVKILTSFSDEDSIKMNLFVKAIENIGEESILDENILKDSDNTHKLQS